MPKVLIHFTRGLGDAVQLTSVLQHLKKYRPDWELFLQALRGKESVGRGYCTRVWHDQEPSPDPAFFERVFKPGWYENYGAYTDTTNSKVTNCLRDVFRIEPDPALLTYKMEISEDAKDITAAYLRGIGCSQGADGRYNAAILHYQGNTSQEKKNLRHEHAAEWCGAMLGACMVPVILDWDRRSLLPDNKQVFRPEVGPGDIWGGFGSGDAERIAALIAQASLFAGIDTGPQKCAGATCTPSVGIWTGHSPVQFFDLCPNFVHLVSEAWRSVPPCNVPGVAAYQEKNYRLEPYRPGELAKRLVELSLRLLDRENAGAPLAWQPHGFFVPQFKPEQSWVIIKDVYVEDAYRTCLRPKADGEEFVIDLGANIGCFTRLWHERNPRAKIVAVEVCPELIPSLEANMGEFAAIEQAACTYEPGELVLLSTFTEAGLSVGGSTVVGADHVTNDPQYRRDAAPLRKITLEEIQNKHGFPRIDVLKLDVEGSEYSILRGWDLSRVHTIFLESHGHAKFQALLKQRFAGWDIGHMSMGGENNDFSNWHLVNPVWPPRSSNTNHEKTKVENTKKINSTEKRRQDPEGSADRSDSINGRQPHVRRRALPSRR